MEKALEVINLSKNYRNIQAVKDVSFFVKKGEIFGLVGPNGAGKSTILKIVATILAPTSGKIKVYNFNSQKHDSQIRRIISYLPEEAGAYKNLTGLGYLKLMASLFAKNKREENTFVDFGIEVSGLKTRLNSRISTYSKGMTRKLLLARTVMTKPQLAILDEPTSGLDVINAYEIRTIIKDLAKQGMAVLLSSHNMLEVEFLSERIAIIHQGAIKEMGLPQPLKEKHQAGNLEEVFIKLNS